MDSYFSTQDAKLCCGCGACEQKCPSGAISMVLNDEGFLYPVVDDERCDNCGLCEKVCPLANGGYTNTSSAEVPQVFAAQHLDKEVLANSTSGGAFTALVDAFCGENYVIFGAEFDDNFFVRHSWITDKQDLQRFRGSKYMQSDTGHCYSQAKAFLDQGQKVLFSGTPCQIAGLKSYLSRDYPNLLCVDLVCYGVPSPLFFKKYKNYLENQYKSKIISINFRDKNRIGWTGSRMSVRFANGKCYSKFGIAIDDSYMKGFLLGFFFRPTCYVCPFAKSRRISDMTIGDFWGIDKYKDDFDYEKGVSLIFVNTALGNTVFNKAKKYLFWEAADFKQAAAENTHLLCPIAEPKNREQASADLQSRSYEELVRLYLKPRPLYRRFLSATLSHKTKRRIRKILRMDVGH